MNKMKRIAALLLCLLTALTCVPALAVTERTGAYETYNYSFEDNGEIAAVVVDNEATLKRVYYYPEAEKLILTAENPAFPPMVFVGPELASIRILGRAVAFQSKVR